MSKVHRLVLNGGLGNQLFQLAALLSSPDTAILEVDLSLGQFQSSTQNPEFTYEMKLPFEINPHRERILAKPKRRIANAILILSEKEKRFSLIALVGLRITLSILLLLSSGQLLRIVTCREIPRFSQGKIKGNCLLIGYFQTAEWASIERVKNQLTQIKLRDSSRDDLIQRTLAKLPNPIGIHYRLGDYANEKNFGALDHTYYSEALKKLGNTNGSILLFSNEPDIAIQRFKEISNSSFVPAPTELSAVETFQLMRSCEKMITANSSLSWWGAFLGRSNLTGGVIVCPSPWFEFLKTSETLLPTGWVKVNPWENDLL